VLVSRGRARFVVALSVMAGWIIVLGIATSLVLYERSQWGDYAPLAAFIAGGFLQDAARRTARTSGWPETVVGTIPWFSHVSSMLFVSASDLRFGAETAGWNVPRVRFIVWLPYWLMLGFCVFLGLNAVAALW
jgi:hypothetical protein